MKRLTDGERDMAGRYFRMAEAAVREHARRCPRITEEIHDAAMLGLVEAASGYDPAATPNFATRAKFLIRMRIRDAIKASKLRLDRKLVPMEWNDAPAEAEAAPAPPHWPHADPFGMAPMEERALLLARFVEGLSLDELSARFGFKSRSNSSRHVRDALSYMSTDPRIKAFNPKAGAT